MFKVSLVMEHIATRFHTHSATIRGSSRTGGTATISSSRLDIAELDNLVKKYFTKGLAESTHRSYNSAQGSYLDFCSRAGLQTIPTTETGLGITNQRETSNNQGIVVYCLHPAY